MVGSFSHVASVLVVAWLFGGMLLFSAGFAAFLFKFLPPTEARMLIRNAFPPFYMFVILSSGLVAALTFRSDSFIAAVMAFVALTTVAARQLLMPAINRATDAGLRKRFVYLHGFSVLLTLGHIVLAAMVLVRMVNK
jgi:hypothetical protein